MPSNDKTYVLGAGGLTGYEIVDVLRRNEKDVVAVVRTPASHADKFSATTSVVAGDVTDASTLGFPDASAVVFACSGAGAYWTSARDVDYNGLVNVVNAAKAQSPPPHVVLVTSRLVNPVNGWHPVRMILNNIKRGLMDNKWASEQYLRASGLPYTIVRPGGLVGGGHGSDGVPNREPGADELVVAGAEGDMQGGRDVLRKDVAALIASVLEKPEAAAGKTIEVIGKTAGEPATGEPATGEPATGEPVTQSLASKIAKVPKDVKEDNKL
ncbi:hypothetical protein TeGR_g4473 [Tetraparma gracilis]|uniref:NAD(P)-binding domain-containing protein n=1 Tax=Tetraparma gracilis TaxID=2962635 RepID=A0ABQ6MUM0_9STRA|nr:hypothetical protein TeGR_g4473 [Tetraparma gracilis]